jgi:nucleoside-diphosphate-sugar epimerase
MIRAADFLTSTTFYRPGLVVGDSRTGFTTAPDFGLYHYIHFNTQLSRQLRASGLEGTMKVPFRLRFTGDERRNIVTVDWVSDVIVHILTHPEYHNETYHLTPDHPSSSRAIVDALAKYFDYEGVEFIGPVDIPPAERTEIEKLFYDYASTFESYWEEEATYDRTNINRVTKDLPTPVVDEECLHRLIDFAVVHCFSNGGKAPSLT